MEEPMMDEGTKKAMTPQHHHNEGRALAMSMPGLLFLGPQKNVIASNAEAIRILIGLGAVVDEPPPAWLIGVIMLVAALGALWVAVGGSG
jgi:hypothetical protein